MTSLEIFLWGFGGSFAVEVVSLYQHYNSNKSSLPDRYKKFPFWIIRFLLAVVAGGLALAYEIDKALLAANVGAATPLIIQSLAEGITSNPSGSPDG